MDQVPADAGQDRSEAVCRTSFSSSDDSGRGYSRRLPSKSCTCSDSAAAALLSVVACANPFRISIHFAGLLLLVHSCGTGNLLDRSNGEVIGLSSAPVAAPRSWLNTQQRYRPIQLLNIPTSVAKQFRPEPISAPQQNSRWE